MKEEKLIRFLIAACPTICFVLVVSVVCLFTIPCVDASLMQMNDRHLFGATYMTMSNPYYQILDEQIRILIEANGDQLISRDAGMHQEKQTQQVQEWRRTESF